MLSDVVCRNTKPGQKPFESTDSAALSLRVAHWRQALAVRLTSRRQAAYRSLGAYPIISLAEARKSRDDLKRQLAGQLDPAQVAREWKRARVLLASNTFERIAREWFAMKLAGWTPSYSDRLMSRLEANVFPPLGRRAITEIEPPDVLEVIPSWWAARRSPPR